MDHGRPGRRRSLVQALLGVDANQQKRPAEEAAALNNHGSWYNAQLAAYFLLVDRIRQKGAPGEQGEADCHDCLGHGLFRAVLLVRIHAK